MNIRHGFIKFVESRKKVCKNDKPAAFPHARDKQLFADAMKRSEALGLLDFWPRPSPLVRLLRRLSLPAKITLYPSAVMVQSRKQVRLYQGLFHSGRDNEELTHVTYSAVVEPVASTLTANRSLTTAQRHSLHSVESTESYLFGIGRTPNYQVLCPVLRSLIVPIISVSFGNSGSFWSRSSTTSSVKRQQDAPCNQSRPGVVPSYNYLSRLCSLIGTFNQNHRHG